MRVVGSNRFYLNPSEKETLDRMARDRHCGGLAMHGGASDGDSSESLEEISAEDFSKRSRGGRYGMRKGYLMSKNFAPNLYSFAWAQTVENKPLGFDTMPMIAGDLVANDASAVKNEKEEACDVIIMDSWYDSDREIEKEEREIELRSELVAEETTGHACAKPNKEAEKKESDGEGLPSVEDFDMRVGLILEALDAITVEEALTSFDGACSRLRKLFEDLKPMFTGIKSSDRVLNALVQRAFMGIQTIYSALDSVTMQRREQNIQLLLGLLIHIKNQYSLLLIPELLKEMDTVVSSLAIESRIKEKGQLGGIGSNINNLTVLSKDPGILSNGSISLEKPYLDQKAVELHKLELPIPPASRNRVEFGPLLDLHADYVVDSLPSLRRENLPRHLVPKPVGLRMVPPASSQTTAKIEGAEYVLSHPYVTDASKAVSSYHLKFGSSSFQSSNQLPSPTPTKERVKDDDSHDEVFISSISANVTTAKRAAQIPIVISSSDGRQLYSVELVGSGSKPALKPALECRDPRFKFMSSALRGPAEGNGGAPDNVLVHGTSNSRKHKTVDEPVAREHRMKRQRNEFPSTGDMKITSDGHEWLEDNIITSESNNRSQAYEKFPVGIKNPATSTVDSGKNLASKSNFLGLNGLNSNPSSNLASDVSLPSLLKAVNPAILMQLHQMEQKRIAAENLQRATASTSVVGIVSNDNGFPGLVSSISSTSFISKDVGEYQQVISQIPPLLASANTQTDIGRIHMKPCDPRHVLHNNMFEKNEAIFSEENKIRAIFGSQSSMGCLSAREPGEQAESSVSSKLFCIPTPPNGSQQLSKNLVNFLSNYQKIFTAPVFSHSNSVPIINKANQVDAKPTSAELLDSNSTTSVEVSEASVGGASQSANSWRDLDHLLAGFNDEQKASIQRERARRVAEQNIMFAARKLCLVLDLDHTLLNSVKFVEVDPFHEEMLRRKEEQDREMQQRHLFRLQYMGMWTKLRPGVWNFLEKASKLYELHLYTMGNKHYATEMAKVLDPTGTLFSGRVMSRGDDDPFDGDERVPKIKDLDGVLGMESAVVIIDDTRRVWPHNKHNLIVVERYTYFPSSRRQFGLLGPSLLEIQHDERLEDGTLASALAVIERLHQIFFSHHCLKDVDVRNILAAEQRKILAGCRIVFSRIFPVGEANPRLHPLWQTAEQFGAVCTNLIDEEVTHVVANSLGTDKVNWALSTGRFVVHPGWVEASALLYRRANEQDYAVRTMA